MTVQDYRLSLPYGSTEPPYGTTDFPVHRGDDYACPENTPLVVSGVEIGRSGSTGMADGPHCHVQEWNGNVYNTRKPQNAFKPGVVVHVSKDPSQQWGMYITVRNEDGWNTTYCHLSKVTARDGDILKGEDMLTKEQIITIHKLIYTNREPGPGLVEGWVGKPLDDFLQAMRDKTWTDWVQHVADLEAGVSASDATKKLEQIKKIVS
jgi:hypothetical protein